MIIKDKPKKRRKYRRKQAFYITVRSNKPELFERTYRREGFTQFEVLQAFVKAMPKVLEDYYPCRISEPIPVKVEKDRTKFRRKCAQLWVFERRIINKIIKKREEFKQTKGSNWDIALRSYVKHHNPKFTNYFDYNWELNQDGLDALE